MEPSDVSQYIQKDNGYELAEAPTPELRPDLELIQRPPRWCPACGYDLTMVDVPPCPRCERSFIPGDASTYAEEPIEPPHNSWINARRVAGYVAIPLFLLGRVIIHTATPGWGLMIDGEAGTNRAESSVGVVAAVFLVLLFIPWLIATTLLVLIALSNYYNPRTAICLVLGAGLGIFLTLGVSPVLLLVGLMRKVIVIPQRLINIVVG